MNNNAEGVPLDFSDELLRLPEGKEPPLEGEVEEPKRAEKERDSQTKKVAEAVFESGQAELFHDERTAYTLVKIEGHQEVMAIRSRQFKLFVWNLYYNRTNTIPGSQTINDATALIEAKAIYEGEKHKVYTRVAPGADGSIYLDLADEQWCVIHITANGWTIATDPPVRFRRPDSMRALPMPQPGALDDLYPFLNVATDEAFTLLKGFLAQALRPSGPYPIAYLSGQQGSAKSTACRILRALIDPAKGEIRCAPKEEGDLIIAANNSHLVALDNLSRLEPWLSDAMCRLATGGGLSKRQLYTDQDEVIIEVQRPQLLNAIEELAFRGDFAERAVTITMKPIEERRRRDETEFWAEFREQQPHILGGLLSVVSMAIRQLPETKLERKPRMADFALWCTAAEPELAPAGSFMKAYGGNLRLAQENVLEASLVAPYITKLIEDHNGIWTGNTKQLLGELNERSRNAGNEAEQKDKSWPRTPHKLAGILRRLAVALLSSGIQYTEPDRHTMARKLQLQRVPGTTASKASTANSLSHSDLDDAVPHADAVAMPSLNSEKGMAQAVGKSANYADNAVHAVSPPNSLPSCPKCGGSALYRSEAGSVTCLTCES